MVQKILVVDDSQADRDHLTNLLTGAGYSVDTAENGEKAIEQVKASAPDAILMDVNMPEMDGFAATRALKNDAATKDIPVVLVTSKDQKADKAWGQMLGAAGYVTKPYADDEIVSTVKGL